MSLLILIDGLPWAVSTPDNTHGVDRVGCMDSLPVLDRLAAVGETGVLRFAETGREPEEGGAHVELFGCDLSSVCSADTDVPVGYAAALGLLGGEGDPAPDPGLTWCCLGFTHLYRKQNDLLFLSPERTGQTVEECRRLAEACLPAFMDQGWSLHVPEHEVLSASSPAMLLLSRPFSQDRPAAVRTTPLAALEGHALLNKQPAGRDASHFMQLLTGGQLSLARHPINLERQRLGRVVLNTPWIWGVGCGHGLVASPRKKTRGVCWSGHPVVAGLASQEGLTKAPLDEEADFVPLVAAVQRALAEGSVCVHFQQPAVLARHSLYGESTQFLKRLNDQFLEPLVRGVARMQKTVWVTSSCVLTQPGQEGAASPVAWVAASGRALSRKRRFWHRRRVGQGDALTVSEFRALWLA